MGATLTTADKALKEFYLPEMREQLNQKTKFLDLIESDSIDVVGREVVLSVHVSRNTGVGGRASGADLPTAGNQGITDQRVQMFRNFGRIEVEGDLVLAMASDAGSFGRAVDIETKGVVRDLRRDLNRQCWNDSTKTVAKCGVTSSDNEIVLASDTPDNIMRFFEVGMKVDIGTAADPDSLIAGEAITAINKTTKTITVTTAITTSAVHFVGREGVERNELTGLREIVAASGTLHNIDPTVHPVWASTVDDNSGSNRSVTEVLLETVVDDTEQESGEDVKVAFSSKGVRRAIAALMQSQKRYGNSDDVNPGFRGITLDVGETSVDLYTDRDCPNNRVFFLNTDYIKQHQMSDWDWMDDDGAVMSRVSNKFAYEATLYKLSEITTSMRNAHGLLADITEA